MIPAYNQAKFLKEAIQSVLLQSFHDYEIIVVDDGSTDETRFVANQFGSFVHYIYQANKGLGAARNTGIQNARGRYIAFLDSDDLWMPEFLDSMVGLATANPDGSVFYCSARYMDEEGHALPQLIEPKLDGSSGMYESLVKANTLIPSTVVLLRTVIVAEGLFDQTSTAIHGCEDWDLWLRLAPHYRFVSTSKCLVRYRVHGGSFSADPGKMQRAAMAVIQKHFGLDDGSPKQWERIKQIAYGGVYRYNAWTYVVKQNNWEACMQSVRQALLADPATCVDFDLFYDLAMGSQPMGMRGTSFKIDLNANISYIDRLLSQLFDSPAPSEVRLLRKQTYGTAYFTIGLVAYQIDELTLCRKYLLKALFFRPDLWRDPRTARNLIKSFLGRRLLCSLRKFRNHRPYSLSSN